MPLKLTLMTAFPPLPSQVTTAQSYLSDFALERPANLPSIRQLEVMCGKDHLTVQLSFTAPFQVQWRTSLSMS